MSKYTYDELEKALGKGFSLEAMDDEKTQARVLQGKADVAFIDFKTGKIETDLRVRWHKAEAASVPEGFPDTDDIAAAQAEMRENLLPMWETEGFEAEGDGSRGVYWYEKEPDRKMTDLSVDVFCVVDTLEEAVKKLHWMATTETEVWL